LHQNNILIDATLAYRLPSAISREGRSICTLCQPMWCSAAASGSVPNLIAEVHLSRRQELVQQQKGKQQQEQQQQLTYSTSSEPGQQRPWWCGCGGARCGHKQRASWPAVSWSCCSCRCAQTGVLMMQAVQVGWWCMSGVGICL